MLFMGTSKYPNENEYIQFIKNNGGSRNGFTTLTDTNFHFEISNIGLEGALERFSAFFICPLLSESATEREMMAVNSEFNYYLQTDYWRKINMMLTLSHEESHLNRFGSGNFESLRQ
jgi:insulysin